MLLRAFVLVALLVAGCATVTPTPEVESLNPVSEGRSFALTDGFKMGAFELLPGKYAAAWSNTLGTIYLGPQRSLLQNPTTGKWWAYQGGVWIPSEKSAIRVPRLVTIGGSVAEFRDRASAVSASQPQTPRDATEVGTSLLLANPPVTVAGALGGAIGVGIVAAVIEEDARKYRGKPGFIMVSRPPGIFEPMSFTPAAAADFDRVAVWASEAAPK